MIQTIKMENWFGSEGSNILDVVQDGRHFKAKFNLITVNNYLQWLYLENLTGISLLFSAF